MSAFSALFSRNSIFLTTVFAGTFAFQGFFDAGVTKWYENHNKGKLWKDIKSKYTGGDDEDEEDDE